MTKLEIINNIEVCRACKFRDHLRYGDLPIIGAGHTPAKLMLVNLRSTIEAHLVEKPLAAKNEALLIKILQEAQVPKSDIYLTNLVKCSGPMTPAKEFIANGKVCANNHLTQEIELVQPKAIVCFGSSIPKILLNDTNASVSSEYTMPNGRNMFVTYSMEELYRRGQRYMDEAIQTIKKAYAC
jgi:uracil-DNA glycosylase family 4